MGTKYTLIFDKSESQIGGAPNHFMMPEGFEGNVKIYAWGAGGGQGGATRVAPAPGGGGSFAYTEVEIKPYDNVEIIVGQPGKDALGTSFPSTGGAGGQGSLTSNDFDGGAGGDGNDYDGDGDGGFPGGGGGAASAVLVNGVPVCVAAGGGGGGGVGDDWYPGTPGFGGDNYPAYTPGIYFKTYAGGSWSQFMNNLAIWSNPRVDTKVIRFTINFPVAGTYTFNYASDNESNFTIDNGATLGSLSGSSAFKNDHTLTQSLSAGFHVITATVTNTGGPGGWAMEIFKPDGTLLWNSLELLGFTGLISYAKGIRRGGEGKDNSSGGGGGGGGYYGGLGGLGAGQNGGQGGYGGQSFGSRIKPGIGIASGGKNEPYYPKGQRIGDAGSQGYVVMEFQQKFRAWTKVSGSWKSMEDAWVKIKQETDVVQTIEFNKDTAWTIPPSVTSIDVEMIGGGGAGGSSFRKSTNNIGQFGGGGGGSGGYLKTTLTRTQGVFPKNTIYIEVGQGGGNADIASYSVEFLRNKGSFLQVDDDPALDMALDNFTIEAWIYPYSLAGAGSMSAIAGKRQKVTDTSPFLIGLVNGRLKTFMAQSFASWDLGQNTGDLTIGGISSTNSIETGTWTHVAVVKSGNSVRQYINGVLDGSGTLRFSNYALYANNIDMTIGAGSTDDDTGLGYTFDGLISNFRIVKGNDVYINNFNIPKLPLRNEQVSATNIRSVNSDQVSLLTCYDNQDFIDLSKNTIFIAPINSPVLDTRNPFDILSYRNGSDSVFRAPGSGIGIYELRARGGQAGQDADYITNKPGQGGVGGFTNPLKESSLIPFWRNTRQIYANQGDIGQSGNKSTNFEMISPATTPGSAAGGRGADTPFGTGGAGGIGGNNGSDGQGYGSGGGGAGCDAPGTFATLFNFSNSSAYSINYDITVGSFSNVANIATPGVSIAQIALFGSTANANISYDTITIGGQILYNRTVTSIDKIDLSKQIGVEYQVIKGGSGWGDPPEQAANDFLYLQYSTNGTQWVNLDTVQPKQLVANSWVTRSIILPTAAKISSGVYLRYLNSGKAALGLTLSGYQVYSSSNSNYATPNTLVNNWNFLHDNSQNYTAEFWFNHSLTNAVSGGTGSPIWTSGGASNSLPGMCMTFNNSSGNPFGAVSRSIQLYVFDGDNGYRVWSTGSNVFTVNTWTHLAMVWDTTTGPTLYVDGVAKTFTLKGTNWHGYNNAENAFSNLKLGQMQGSLYALRIVKDKVYTSGFTPSVAPLSNISNTYLLTFQDGTFIDQSANAWTLTNVGLLYVSAGALANVRDTWAVTSIQNTTNIDTRNAYQGGRGADGIVRLTYTQAVAGTSIWKPLKQIYVKYQGKWVPLISNSKIPLALKNTRHYRSTQVNQFVVPAGVDRLYLTMVGGGGGGGALSNLYSKSPKLSGAAGRSGSLIYGNIAVTPGDVVDIAVGGAGGAGSAGQTNFYTKSGVYTYIVPPGITSLRMAVIGAGGGGGGGLYGYYDEDTGNGQDGKSGHYLEGNISVVPGDVLTFEVGEGGQAGSQGTKRIGGRGGRSPTGDIKYAGGQGGSSGTTGWSGAGGGGGAATVVKKNGTVVAVAAGGAGGGGGGSRVDNSYWYPIGRRVWYWNNFLSDYAIWRYPYNATHKYNLNIYFPVTGVYQVRYSTSGYLRWKLQTQSPVTIENGNIANVFVSNITISSTGNYNLDARVKNYTETGGWALQILKPDGSQLWNTRLGYADEFTQNEADPNPALELTGYVASGNTAGGTGEVSARNGGGGGGGGGGYPAGGIGGPVQDPVVTYRTFSGANVLLPGMAWQGYFTRTAAATSTISSIREYFIRYEGKTIYNGTNPPPAKFQPGAYRGSQFGVYEGGGGSSGLGNKNSTKTQLFTTNSTFTVPANVATITVTAVGGGGGGGGAQWTQFPLYTGGAGSIGQVVTANLAVSAGEVYTVTIGGGGSGGAAGTSTGQPIFNDQTVNLTSGSGSWAVPAGVTSITVDVFGGAGGGGSYHKGCSGTTTHPGGNGGRGGRVRKTIAVTPGQIFSYSVGAGGAGGVGTSVSTSGAAGSSSTFANVSLVVNIVASGGTGGIYGTGSGPGANGADAAADGALGGLGGKNRDTDPSGKAGSNGYIQILYSKPVGIDNLSEGLPGTAGQTTSFANVALGKSVSAGGGTAGSQKGGTYVNGAFSSQGGAGAKGWAYGSNNYGNAGSGGGYNYPGKPLAGTSGAAGAVLITYTLLQDYSDYLNCFDLKVEQELGWGGYTGSDGSDLLPAGWTERLDPAIPNDVVWDLDNVANLILGNGVALRPYDEVEGKITGINIQTPGVDGNIAVFGYSGVSTNPQLRTIRTADRVDLSDYEQLYYEVNMGTSADWGEAPDYNEEEYIQLEFSIDGDTWTKLDTTWPWWYWNDYRDYSYRWWKDNYYYYNWYHYYYWNNHYNYKKAVPNTWMTKVADLPEEARQIGGVYLRFVQNRRGPTANPQDTWAVTSVLSVGRREEGAASNGGRGSYRNNWHGRWWRHSWWWYGWYYVGYWRSYWVSNAGKDGAVYFVPTEGIGPGAGGDNWLGYRGGRGGASIIDPNFIELTNYNSVAFNGKTKTKVTVDDDSALDMQDNDFTIEAFVYPTRFDEFDTIVTKRNNSTTNYAPFLIGLRSGKLQTFISQSGTGWTLGANTSANMSNVSTRNGGSIHSVPLTLNEWTHIAVVRQGSTIKSFVDGVQVTSDTLTSGNASVMSNSANVIIGNSSEMGSDGFNGYIHGLRITKGQAVYAGDFPVVSSPMTATQAAGANIAAISGANVSLLACQNTVFTENSTYGLPVRAKGSAKIEQSDPFVRSFAHQFVVKGIYNNLGAGGGGGGGASVIRINGNVVAVAGGGAGGAGALGNNESALPSLGYFTSGNIAGGGGTNRASSGGGGGGGGGGYLGGLGGQLVPGNKGGYAGSDGADLVPNTWTVDDSKVKNAGSAGQSGKIGSITISYYKK